MLIDCFPEISERLIRLGGKTYSNKVKLFRHDKLVGDVSKKFIKIGYKEIERLKKYPNFEYDLIVENKDNLLCIECKTVSLPARQKKYSNIKELKGNAKSFFKTHKVILTF